MNFESLGSHVTNSFIFRGSKTKPFLAPRGVFVAGDSLFVSDTGQNRVFIWDGIPKTEFAEPSVVLGQDNIEASARNRGGKVTSRTLHYPSGIWSDGEKLIVADAWNHRVLIWKKTPSQDGQAADVVIGQPDFHSNEPNVLGIGANPSAKTLNWPYGVFSNGKELWVADTGNRRILYYSNLPEEDFQAADEVIGKQNMHTRDYNNNDPIWPYSVKVNGDGELVVADTQFYRALLWKNWRHAIKNPADTIIGQTDFNACGQNQFGLFPSEKSLNWTYDACFYKKGLLVNDTGNSRILYFKDLPRAHNASADIVIGKRDFKTGSENKETMLGTESSLYWPFSISTFGSSIVIADTGNHRLVFSELSV